MANLHGSIDPVAWQNPLHPDQLSSKPIPNWTPLYTAAPVAQQPQADSIPVAAFDRLMALCESQAQRIIELEDKQPQAEAVPPDVVRDAKRYRWLRNESWAGYNTGKGTPSVYTVDGAGNRRMMLAEEAMDDAIDAAIAQQKGGA